MLASTPIGMEIYTIQKIVSVPESIINFRHTHLIYCFKYFRYSANGSNVPFAPPLL